MARILLSITSALSASTPQVANFSQDQLLHRIFTAATTIATRNFQATSQRFGLEEFFDDPKNYGESMVKSGRPWRADELRLKSNADLHKLWYVLYKERNMLYTMKEAAEHDVEVFPSPERIDKVEVSMQNLEKVVMERNKAYWQLEVSPCVDGIRPRVFRKDIFGRFRWQSCSQHLPPFARNKAWKMGLGPGEHSEVEWFTNRYREMRRRQHNRLRSRTARYLRDLFRRFPDADADYIAEQHPEFPPGYVNHLKENHFLYEYDRPRNRRLGTVFAASRQLDHKEERMLE